MGKKRRQDEEEMKEQVLHQMSFSNFINRLLGDKIKDTQNNIHTNYEITFPFADKHDGKSTLVLSGSLDEIWWNLKRDYSEELKRAIHTELTNHFIYRFGSGITFAIFCLIDLPEFYLICKLCGEIAQALVAQEPHAWKGAALFGATTLTIASNLGIFGVFKKLMNHHATVDNKILFLHQHIDGNLTV